MPSFFEMIGASPETPMFLVRLPNTRGDPNVPFRWTRARTAIEVSQFIGQYDAPGAAVYFTAADIKDGATTRSSETVERARVAWAEIDFKDHPSLSAEEIDRRIAASPVPPTIIVNSGHGRHLYWKLAEPVDLTGDDGRHRLVETLKLLCAHIGGDPAVCEVARLLRLPRTTARAAAACQSRY